MHISNCGHSVDLEVLVRANGRCFLDRTPVRKGWLCIVEPLVAELFHVVSVEIGDTLSDFGSGYASVKIEHLGAYLLHGIRG